MRRHHSAQSVVLLYLVGEEDAEKAMKQNKLVYVSARPSAVTRESRRR